ncbi:MAG: hypothetical protein U9Q88_13170 [Bacillota bacterium]|nr:hypothetical protein [Bacillota bacterium]
MDKLTVKVISAFNSIIIFLTFCVFYIMTGEFISDLVATVFWFGSVGFIITLVFGVPVSFLLEWILNKTKIKRGTKYNVIFIVLHLLAGTAVPILGNIVSVIFAITHLLLEKGYKNRVLFFLVCAIFFITSGIMLEWKFDESNNMNLDNMIQFLVLFGIGFTAIMLSSFWLFNGKPKRKLIVTALSFCIVFLPCSIHLLNAHQDFKTKYEQEKALAELYDGVEKEFPDLELDLIRSFENGDVLDLTVHKSSTGFSVESIEEFVDFLPKRINGYYVQIYEDQEYLYLTIDSENRLIDCEHVNAKNSVCNMF